MIKQNLERILHQKIELHDFTKIDLLPLYLRGLYEYEILQIANVVCLLAKPKDPVNLASLRKHAIQIRKYTELEVIFYFDSLRTYMKNKMLEERIPFILNSGQVFIPFLGTYLISENKKQEYRTEQISFLAQKFLLTSIYDGWDMITASDAARALHVSRMSMSRVFDELENRGLNYIQRTSSTRSFVKKESARKFWDTIRPELRTPVKKIFRLENKVAQNGMLLSGFSALSHYTMIGDDEVPTYAIESQKARELNFDSFRIVPKGETPGSIIQVVGYVIRLTEENVIDPLSAVLTISDEDKNDPRVEQAVTTLIKESIHD